VTFVLFSQTDYEHYAEALEAVTGEDAIE